VALSAQVYGEVVTVVHCVDPADWQWNNTKLNLMKQDIRMDTVVLRVGMRLHLCVTSFTCSVVGYICQ